MDDFDPTKEKQCQCQHRMQGTGAVFFHSIGWLYCNNCRGWQRIRKIIT
jgi:hypothetical protein